MYDFKQNELIPQSSLCPQNTIIKDIVNGDITKAAIVYNDKPVVVLLPIEKYEKLMVLEEQLEDELIYQEIEPRLKDLDNPSKWVTQKDMDAYFKKRGIGAI